MRNVYTAIYKCNVKTPIGLPGYYDVILGLPGHVEGGGMLVIKATCSDFVIGKEYFIHITE